MHCHRYVSSIKIYPLCHGESLTTKCEWLYVYLDWIGLLVGNKSAVKTVGNIVSTYYILCSKMLLPYTYSRYPIFSV